MKKKRTNIKKSAIEKFIIWGNKMMKENPHKLLSFSEAINKAKQLSEIEKNEKNNHFVDINKMV